jgi:hypothetical protein
MKAGKERFCLTRMSDGGNNGGVQVVLGATVKRFLLRLLVKRFFFCPHG